MKISFKWLQEYIHLEGSAEEIGKLLTSSGLEVEAIEKIETIPGSGVVCKLVFRTINDNEAVSAVIFSAVFL